MSAYRPLSLVTALLAGLFAPVLSMPLQAADETVPAGLCYAATAEGGRIVVPLEYTEVVLDITPGLMEAEVTQVFTNRTETALEATYLYPLPPGATITSFELRLGDRVIRSVVREKQQAKAEYEVAKAEGKKAALLAQHDPSLFSTAVANFLPGETVHIVLKFIQPVALRPDASEVRFPMVTGQKYFPADAAPVAKGNADVAPERSVAAGHVYAFDVLVSGFPVEEITSSSHHIRVESTPAGSYRVSLVDEISVPDRDFVLNIATKPARGAQATIITQAGPTGQHGLLTVFAPTRQQAANPAPGGRDFLFLIDHSGSMGDTRMASARLGVQGCLLNLAVEDRFQIVIFDSKHEFYQPEWIQATPAAVAEAVLWVEKVQSNSGTEMQPALNASLDFIQRGGAPARPNHIVFLTDGDVGNEGALITLLESRIGQTRLFTFGVGSAPNSYLIQKMAEAGRGLARFVADDAGVAREMADLFASLAAPVWTDLRLNLLDEAGAPMAGMLLPRQLSDVFAGQSIQATFHTGNLTPAAVVIEAQEAGGPVRLRLPVAATVRGDGLARLFGHKLHEEQESLLRRAATDEQRTAVRAEMLRIALSYQLVTEQTSRVAIDRVVARTPGAPLRTANVAQQASAGDQDGDDVVVLSPFDVSAGDDNGYTSATAVSGSRLNTTLCDIGSSVTVVTSQFLSDIAVGARQEELLSYLRQPDSDVAGGPRGNFAASLDSLPLVSLGDPTFIDTITVQPVHRNRLLVTQSRAVAKNRATLSARVGDEGYSAVTLDASAILQKDKTLTGRAIITHTRQEKAQTGALVDVRKNLGDHVARGSLQWQRFAGYGSARLLKASFGREGSDRFSYGATVAWHEIRRTDAAQFGLGSPDATYDNLGFLNPDLLTAPTRRLKDTVAQMVFYSQLPIETGRHTVSLVGTWHRQESDWRAPETAGARRQDNTGVELWWQSSTDDRKGALEASLDLTALRTPGHTVASRRTRAASIMASWELLAGLRLFGRYTDEEFAPWLATGRYRLNGGRWLAVSPEQAGSRGGQLGLRWTAADGRLVAETAIFRENLRDSSYRDWAWELAHLANGREVLPNGDLRDAFSYATWPELQREGWTGDISLQPIRALRSTLKWSVDWKNSGPYIGGNRRASVVAAYTFQEGRFKGLTAGGGLNARNTLRFNDGYRLRGAVSWDLFLTYEYRLGGRRLSTQLNMVNLNGAPAQLTRFSPDHGRRLTLSQKVEF